MAFPRNSTVHAPHSPSPQPYLVPVRPRRLRNTESKDSPETDSVLCSLPLTLRVMAGMGLDQNNTHMLTPSPRRLPLDSSGLGAGRAFGFEQRGLAFGSPAITGERAVLLYHAMAGHDYGHRVGSA